MSVQKFTPFIENESIPYAQIRQEVIDNIENLEAGFVWVYLISKPKSWIVIKEHLRKRFNIGEVKLKKIFSYLHKCNLIEYIQEKGEKGVFGKTNIRVLNGSKIKSYPQKLTAGSIPVRAVSCPNGKPELVINNKHKEITKQRERTKKRAPHSVSENQSRTTAKVEPTRVKRPPVAKRAPLTPDFEPDQRRLELTCQVAERVGLEANKLFGKFVNVMKSSGKTSIDWNAELEKFLLSERPVKSKTTPKSEEPRCTVPEYGAGHPAWEAQQQWEASRNKRREELTKLN